MFLDIGPYLFAGVQFRTVGRDVEQVDIIRYIHILDRVEAGIVDDHHFVFTWFKLGKSLKVLVENLFVHPVYFPNERAAVQGRIAAIKIGGLEPVLIGGHRPNAPCGYAAAHVGHQAEPGLVLEIKVHRIVFSFVFIQFILNITECGG